MKWFYIKNDQREGPIDKENFLKLFESGAINHQTLFWKEGMAQPKAVADIPSLNVWTKGDTTPLPEHTEQCDFNPWADQYPENEKPKLATCPTCKAQVHADKIFLNDGLKVCGNCFDSDAEAEEAAESSAHKKALVDAEEFHSSNALLAIGQAIVNFFHQWFRSIIFSYIHLLVALLLSPLLIFSGALITGYSKFWLNVAQREPANISHLFCGFKIFFKSLSAYCLLGLTILSAIGAVGVGGYLIIPEKCATLVDTAQSNLTVLQSSEITSAHEFKTAVVAALENAYLEWPNQLVLEQSSIMFIVLTVLMVLLLLNLLIRWSQVFMVLADQPLTPVFLAFAQSNRIMRKQKIKFFIMILILLLLNITMIGGFVILYSALPPIEPHFVYLFIGAGVLTCTFAYAFSLTAVACFYQNLKQQSFYHTIF